MSLGHLLSRSDSTLITGLWEYVQSIRDWTPGAACGRCDKQMAEIPFTHRGKAAPFQACLSCYLIALSPEVLACFEEANAGKQRLRLEQERRQLLADRERERRAARERASRAVDGLIDRLVFVFTRSKFRTMRLTLALALAAAAFSSLTMLAPYSSLLAFGFSSGSRATQAYESSILLSALAHLDPLHLFGNLYLLLQLGAPVERRLGIARYALFLIGALWVSCLIGPAFALSPETRAVGLSGVNGALLGHVLAWNPRFRFPLLWSRPATRFPLAAAFGLMALLELRAMAPHFGAPIWFTASFAASGLAFGYLVGLMSRGPVADPEVLGPASEEAGALADGAGQVVPLLRRGGVPMGRGSSIEPLRERRAARNG